MLYISLCATTINVIYWLCNDSDTYTMDWFVKARINLSVFRVYNLKHMIEWHHPKSGELGCRCLPWITNVIVSVNVCIATAKIDVFPSRLTLCVICAIPRNCQNSHTMFLISVQGKSFHQSPPPPPPPPLDNAVLRCPSIWFNRPPVSEPGCLPVMVPAEIAFICQITQSKPVGVPNPRCKMLITLQDTVTSY